MTDNAKPRVAGPTRAVAVLFLALALYAALSAPGSAATPDSPVADYLEVTGFLDPAATDFLVRQITAASGRESSLVIVRLDSAGGLDADVGPVLHAIEESAVPVVVWVAPGEARAASSAGLLALAGHLTVLAPDSTIGPAHPLDLARPGGGGEAATRSALGELTSSRGREASRSALDGLVSSAVGAEEAIEEGLIDSIEPTLQELLQSLQAYEVSVAGGRVTLPEDPLTLRFTKMSLLERLTHSAARPDFAYLLLLIGFFGLIFELYNPGLGLAAVAGGVSLGFSFLAFTILPVAWPAVALLLLAMALFTADLRTGALGALSAAASAALVAGTVFLYAGSHAEVGLSWWAGLSGIALTVLFFVSVMTSAVRARTAKPIPGSEGILEAVGVARTDIAPDGQVLARGTLWKARTLGAAIGEGTAVKVLGVSGLMLMVEPTDEAVEDPDPSEPEPGGASPPG